MNNWIVIIYKNLEKSEIAKVLRLDSIKQIAYIVGESPNDVSNFYHKLIFPKNLMKYIDIIKK